jgi:O-antigen/teichoic acid export membrane protein
MSLFAKDSSQSLGTQLLRSLTSGFLFTGLGNFCLFLGQVLIARILSREDYARFAVCVSFVALFSLLADLGLSSLITRLLSKASEEARRGSADRRGEILGSALFVRGVMSVIASCIILIVGSQIYSPSMVSGMAILLLSLLISSRLLVIRSIGESMLRSVGKFHKVAMFVAIDSAAFALLLFAGKYLALSLEGVLWCYVLCNLPGFILLVYTNSRLMKAQDIHLRLSVKDIKELLKAGVPFMLATMFLTIHAQIDNLLLDRLSTPFEVSNYAAIMRLNAAFVAIPMVLTAIIAPEITKLLVRGDNQKCQRLTDLSVRALTVVSILIALTLYLQGQQLVPFLLGSKYASASSLLAWTGYLLVPIFLSTLLMESNTAGGHYWYPVVYTLVIMVLVIAGDLILIPLMGARGAIVSKLCAISAGMVILLFLSRNAPYLQSGKIFLTLFKAYLAACLTAFVFCPLLYDLMPDWIVTFLGLLLFIALARLSLLFRFSELTSFVTRIIVDDKTLEPINN